MLQSHFCKTALVCFAILNGQKITRNEGFEKLDGNSDEAKKCVSECRQLCQGTNAQTRKSARSQCTETPSGN